MGPQKGSPACLTRRWKLKMEAAEIVPQCTRVPRALGDEGRGMGPNVERARLFLSRNGCWWEGKLLRGSCRRQGCPRRFRGGGEFWNNLAHKAGAATPGCSKGLARTSTSTSILRPSLFGSEMGEGEQWRGRGKGKKVPSSSKGSDLSSKQGRENYGRQASKSLEGKLREPHKTQAFKHKHLRPGPPSTTTAWRRRGHARYMNSPHSIGSLTQPYGATQWVATCCSDDVANQNDGLTLSARLPIHSLVIKPRL